MKSDLWFQYVNWKNAIFIITYRGKSSKMVEKGSVLAVV